MVRGLRLEEFAGRFIAGEEELDAELGQRKILGCSELRDRREHRQHGIAEAQVERDDRGERFVGSSSGSAASFSLTAARTASPPTAADSVRKRERT